MDRREFIKTTVRYSILVTLAGIGAFAISKNMEKEAETACPVNTVCGNCPKARTCNK